MEERIKEKLQKNLQPSFLQVKNNSYLHKNHFENAVDSHFAIKVEAACLKGLSRVAAHKKINKILEQEFTDGIHALEIKIL